MIIGIDGNEANIAHRVGVNEYAFQILWGLYKLRDKYKSVKFVVYLKEKPLKDLPHESDNFNYKILPGRGLWIIRVLTPYLLRGRDKLDVFFTPSHYVPPVANTPRVCAIMDLGYLEFSGQFKKYDFWQLKLWSAWSIKASKYVMAISESTKKDIVRHYKFASHKIVVTLLGYDNEKFNSSISSNDVRRVKSKYTISTDYVLFLGTLKPSKNVEGLIKAWKDIAREYTDLSLVIAGKKGWLYESIFKVVKDLGLDGRVIFTDFVDKSDKPPLIKGARAFVLPSFWEGFGIDVVSAMAVGTPVIVSDKGSLPEVAGNAGIVVDPASTSEITHAIKKVLDMSKLDYNRMVKRGLIQTQKFSWQKAAEKTLDTLLKAI